MLSHPYTLSIGEDIAVADIELISSEELFNELFKRYEVIVVMTGKEGKEDDRLQHKGNPYICIGMCEHLKALLLAKSVWVKEEDD